MRQILCEEARLVIGGVGPWSLGTSLCMIFTGAGLVVPGILSFTKLARGDVRHPIFEKPVSGVQLRDVETERTFTLAVQDGTLDSVYANAPRCNCHPVLGLLMLWWGVGLLAGGFCALAGKN